MNKLIYILIALLITGCSIKTPVQLKIKKLEFKSIDSSIMSRSDSQRPFLFLCECK